MAPATDAPKLLNMGIDDPIKKAPSKILAFDSSKKLAPEPVNLDSPFFTIKRPDYSKCDHRNRGVTLDTATRTAVCLCGVVIDNFDALLIYAHAQQRLVYTREAIEAHERKEAEKKAARPFVKTVVGFEQVLHRSGRFLGYRLKLDCGHEKRSERRKPPHRATCQTCFRNSKLTAAGVAVVDTATAQQNI